MVIDGFMEENDLAPPSPKMDISPPQYRRSTRSLKFSQPLATRYKKLFYPNKKNICGWGVYTIENKDVKTGYQEVVRVGDQKW